MKVLLLSQYFAPEVTAAPRRLSPFAAGLSARGHEVTVLTQLPNHPQGVRHAGFRAFPPLQRRQEDGYEVIHVWSHASRSKAAPHRLCSYLTYATSAISVGSVQGRPDVILASSPPLSVAAAGAALARRFRRPWVMDVRDLWPAVAGALGKASGPSLRLATFAERRLYESASAVAVATPGFAEHVGEIVDPSKVVVLENGTTRDWLELGSTEPDREGTGLPRGRFVWTYAGNVGLSQSLQTAIDAAGLLGDDYELLVLGDGASRTSLERRAGSLQTGNVRFRDTVPADEAGRIMRASDALLVSLADKEELGRTVPIKLYDSCAVGRPVVVAAPGAPAKIAVDTGAALAVAPEDPEALAVAIRRLREDTDLAASLTESGRVFAEAHLREDRIDDLEALLLGVRERGRG